MAEQPLNEKEREDLVAYLDGELDAKEAREVEAKLNLNPQARKEAEALKKTWEFLDYLPRPQPSPEFTQRTLEKLAPQPTMQVRRQGRPWLGRIGWAAALLVSGGHRRGGFNEARRMLEIAQALAREERIDLRDRVFVEPCATRTSTNLRNSLRMMAAFGLERGLLVTESKVTGQATVFASDLDALVRRDLRCAVGRVSHLYGMTSLLRPPTTRTARRWCRRLRAEP